MDAAGPAERGRRIGGASMAENRLDSYRVSTNRAGTLVLVGGERPNLRIPAFVQQAWPSAIPEYCTRRNAHGIMYRLTIRSISGRHCGVAFL